MTDNDGGPFGFSPATLPALIKYVRSRRDAVRAEMDLAASYSGPDPSPVQMQKNQAIVDTLDAVLVAIRDIECGNARDRISRDLGLWD